MHNTDQEIGKRLRWILGFSIWDFNKFQVWSCDEIVHSASSSAQNADVAECGDILYLTTPNYAILQFKLTEVEMKNLNSQVNM